MSAMPTLAGALLEGSPIRQQVTLGKGKPDPGAGAGWLWRKVRVGALGSNGGLGTGRGQNGGSWDPVTGAGPLAGGENSVKARYT